MAIKTPTRPVTSFKDSQAKRIQELYICFNDLYCSYLELYKQICNARSNIGSLSDNFARDEISPFRFGRFLTQSENSLSDSIKNLSSLNESLIDTSNKLLDLLPHHTEPNPTSDSSTKH